MENEQNRLLTATDLQDGDNTQSFADKLYEQITSVIGGSNANQFFV